MNVTLGRFLGAVTVVCIVLSTSAEANAPAGRYTTTGGTVLDTKTKLTWQQTGPSALYGWTAAKTYCQTLSLAGTGWRLPTMKELQTLVDFSQTTAPLIDQTAFPATPGAPFWSSSPMASSPIYAWLIFFFNGTTLSNLISNAHDVRCVH